MKGRSITKNILLAQEIIANIRKRGKPINTMIKLNMTKRYDRVDWTYLIHVIEKIGSNNLVVDKVWRLVENS